MKIIRNVPCNSCNKEAHVGGHEHDHGGHMSDAIPKGRKFGTFKVKWVLCYKISPDGKSLEMDIQGIDKQHRGNEIREMFLPFVPQMSGGINFEAHHHDHIDPVKKITPPPPPPGSDESGVLSYKEQDKLIEEERQKEQNNYVPSQQFYQESNE